MDKSLPPPDHPQRPMPQPGGSVKALAVLSLVSSLTITVWAWSLIARQQETWPLPALYFL